MTEQDLFFEYGETEIGHLESKDASLAEVIEKTDVTAAVTPVSHSFKPDAPAKHFPHGEHPAGTFSFLKNQ